MPSWTLRARWVFPIAGPPLENGTVTIDGERITAVGPAGSRPADMDLGNAAVLPGLVNAHTHLDLSGMRGLAPPSPDFTGWLRQVIAHRRERAPEQVRADVRAGLAESLRFGTTLLGDIAAEGASWEVLERAPVRAVVFRELLGLTVERAAAACEGLRWWREGLPESPTCRPGASPHAPYSVRAPLFFHAVARGLPTALHLAESPAEAELLLERRGPFVDFLKELGAWDPDGLVRDFDQVFKLTASFVPVLYAHGNYLPADSAIPPNGSIVYCPRTHAAFGHPPHPFRAFLARGVRVALGTDSLASNPDLDLLAEARLIYLKYPDFPGDALLRMATLSGAEALGWADQTGSLEPGKSADLVVLPLPDAAVRNPHALVFASSQPVRAVLVRGRWVHDAEGIFAPPLGV